MSAAAPILLSWCPGGGSGEPDPNDPCYPCKPKKPPQPQPQPPVGSVYTTSGGWYGIIIPSTYGGPGGFPTWVAIERNVLYDADPFYAGYSIGEFIDPGDALSATAQTISNSKPIITDPIIVPVGPGTKYPPGTTGPGTTWVGANGSTVTK